MAGLEELLQKWPNFVITTLGVLLGAFFALFIERGVANRSLNLQRKLDWERDQAMLLSYLERIEIEVHDNCITIMELQSQILVPLQGANRPAKATLFRWGTKLVSSLSTLVFDDLVRSGLHSGLSKNAFNDLLDARQRTVSMKATIEAGEPRMEFFADLRKDMHLVDELTKSMFEYSNSAVDTLRKAEKSVREQVGILHNLDKKQNG